MNRTFSKSLGVILLILLCAPAFFAQKKRTKRISRGERLVTALMNSKTLPGNFGDDGVFFEGSDGLSPDVIRILELGEKAIPLLISHLDDKRFFKRLTFCCLANQHKPRKVTVGEVALDILTIIVQRNEPMFDLKCIDEGAPEDRCVADGYYDEKIGRRNWLKAYRAGKIDYEKYEY
ncbi:MAG TPA: hypothetical protein VF604_14110 [Pyrinomonadaceae bacterium]|jgi:hypothetical protein